MIALHPHYVFSYAPAIIQEAYAHGFLVTFYDKSCSRLAREEVYKISGDKYRAVVDHIRSAEQRVCGKDTQVVARDDNTGYYVRSKLN